MFSHPEMIIAPGAAIIIIVLAFNFLSDALQIAVDPRFSTHMKKKQVKRGIMT
ncbi:Oligopeptide transporter putative membrane permease domain protein [Staphylococcus aureus]|nr:Oligopeptide transporter putative membrane permease domain protein [Staphylococcus aureus]